VIIELLSTFFFGGVWKSVCWLHFTPTTVFFSQFNGAVFYLHVDNVGQLLLGLFVQFFSSSRMQ
jgi:hypothetical protein